MQTRILMLFTLVALGSGMGCQSALAAEPPALYLSEEGQYRVAFPREPAVITKRLATVVGALPMHTSKVEVKRGLIYSATLTTYPESFISVKSELFLDGVRDGMKSTDGKIAVDQSITLGVERWPGREIIVESGSNAVRSRVYKVNNRMYQVQVAGTKENVRSEASTEFLKSFELVKTK